MGKKPAPKVPKRSRPPRSSKPKTEEDLFAAEHAGLARRAEKIQAKMRTGAKVTDQELRILDAITEGHGPNVGKQAGDDEDEEDAKAPPDVLLPSLRQIAAVLGIHHNTMGNWKAKGIEPVGTMPWSLKAFLLILRPANKLPECHPTTDKAKALWKWAFGVPGAGSVNPDDPAHGPTMGWSEERDRQAALKERTARKVAELELDRKKGAYYDADEVRAMLASLRGTVVGELSSVQNVANQVRGLTPNQRAELAEQLMAWQAEVKQRLAGKAAAAQEAKRAPG